MICEKCGTRLCVVQTISVGPAKVQLAECARCNKRFTAVTLLLGEAMPRKHGTGIRAVAKKLKASIKTNGVPRIDF